MPESFLSRRTKLGVTGGLLILLIFFFLLPSAFRGARLAVANKKNNIKDWLPSDFRETVELDWFAKYFIGESFVVATWDGCNADDQRLTLLATKLRQESAQRDLSAAPPDIGRAREVAEKYQLFVEPAETNNWGGLGEKWFSSALGHQFYITPDGRLYRWNDNSNAVGGLFRSVKRSLGRYELQGQFIAAFGEPTSSSKTNAYYNEPTLLAASLFQSVQTGSDLVDQLAREGGPLWPIDLTDISQRANVAKARAIDRLTGTLFAPAVPDDFTWTPAAVFAHLPEHVRSIVTEDFDFRVRSAVKEIEARAGKLVGPLQLATTEQRNQAWRDVCAAIGVPVPPRQTCVLITLTPFGKEHLAHAIGRGVIGAPRGRLLILADQSGVAAAPSPSMAPPPFDHPETQLADANGRPMLRMGGPPVDNVAIDEEGTVTLARLAGYSGLVGMVIAYLCFRSVKLTIMIFLVGLSSAVLGLAITYWTGGHVDAILMTMPSMVYISGLSGAIHIITYCRDEAREHGADGAIVRGVKHAFAPAILCSLTTALGLWSLCTSNLVPISNFGLYTGFAVMAMLLILFTYLPAALEVFPPQFLLIAPRREVKRSDRLRPEQGVEPNISINWVADAWEAVGRWITNHYRFTTFACSVVFCISLFGLFRIQTTVQLLKLFDPQSRIISDYAYLETNFGKLVPMELVVRIPPAMQAEKQSQHGPTEPTGALSNNDGSVLTTNQHPLTVLERIEAVNRIDTVARRALGEAGMGVIGKTMSAVTFLPPLPDPSTGYELTRAKFQRDLKASLPDLEQTDYFRFEETGPRQGSELWRISLRVGALSNVDFGQFVGDLRLAVSPVIHAYRARAMILDRLQQRHAQTHSRDLPRILFLGHREPKRLEEESLLDTVALDTSAIGTPTDATALIHIETIYAATIGELMSGEKVKRPIWIDVEAEDAKIRPGDENWNKLLSLVDCVVLVDDQPGIDVNELEQSAKYFVDARLSSMPVAEPMLDGAVPVEANAGPLEAVYTGIIPVVYKAQRTLLVSLIESTGMASVSIAIVMAILMLPGRFPRALIQPKVIYCGAMAGLVAMIPNMFPIIMVFGFMGHLNVLIDIGTMMTASVALGIAVDDTIHFLSWFRQFIDEGMDRVDAVIETYRRVGPAMLQTAIVGGLGMFVFALSTFTPTQRFGTLMLVMLATALLGDLVLLPALLAGPLGRWFKPRSFGANLAARQANELVTESTDRLTTETQLNQAHLRQSPLNQAPLNQSSPPAPKAIDRGTRAQVRHNREL